MKSLKRSQKLKRRARHRRKMTGPSDHKKNEKDSVK